MQGILQQTTWKKFHIQLGKKKKLYWPKYCMDWKLAEGPEAKTVDAAVI